LTRAIADESSAPALVASGGAFDGAGCETSGLEAGVHFLERRLAPATLVLSTEVRTTARSRWWLCSASIVTRSEFSLEARLLALVERLQLRVSVSVLFLLTRATVVGTTVVRTTVTACWWCPAWLSLIRMRTIRRAVRMLRLHVDLELLLARKNGRSIFGVNFVRTLLKAALLRRLHARVDVTDGLLVEGHRGADKDCEKQQLHF